MMPTDRALEEHAMKRLVGSILVAGLLAAACGPESGSPDASSSNPIDTPSPVATTSGPIPTPSGSGEPEEPRFHGSSRRINPGTRARMTGSWRPGCPVPIEDLRLLYIDHWGFDGKVHHGEMVVHWNYARDVLTVIEALFDAKFPIRRMQLVDEYGADDDRSMAANNTSAFNCRPVTGGTRWSEHSYGWAIDINPIQNPYVTSGGTVLPPAGARYADRSLRAKGMVRTNGVVVKAFAAVGWSWGGYWSSIKDYQHFSKTGR
jgi:hypothetical protein